MQFVADEGSIEALTLYSLHDVHGENTVAAKALLVCEPRDRHSRLLTQQHTSGDPHLGWQSVI